MLLWECSRSSNPQVARSSRVWRASKSKELGKIA